MDLSGKISLVTGGSRGIGKAISLALATEGSAVAINYVSNEDAAERVVEDLKMKGVKAKAFKGDVSDEEQANILIERVISEFGQVDVLINNAGITRDRSFLKMTADQWHEVIRVNLDGMFYLTQRLLPEMVKRHWGRIINIASVVGQMGNFGQANYAATKGGMIAFTKTIAREVAKKGVTANAIAPGFIKTDMVGAMPEEAIKKVVDQIPVGRLGEPEDVARCATFLASPHAGFITGQVIAANGGMYM